jgi:hypothetical protein
MLPKAPAPNCRDGLRGGEGCAQGPSVRSLVGHRGMRPPPLRKAHRHGVMEKMQVLGRTRLSVGDGKPARTQTTLSIYFEEPEQKSRALSHPTLRIFVRQAAAWLHV